MAFKKINPANINDMVNELYLFCKNELNWNTASVSGAVYTFKPRADSATFKIDNIRSAEYGYNSNPVTKIPFVTLDVYNTGCNGKKSNAGWLTGFKNVWFKGDANGVFVVIEVSNRNFRWFGFGDIPKPHSSLKSNIEWCVGCTIPKSALTDTYWRFDYFLNIDIFGGNATRLIWNRMNGANWDNPQIYENTVKYNNIVYRAESYRVEKYWFGGGSNSIPYSMAMNYAANTYLGGAILSKQVLFIREENNAPTEVLCELPFIYATYVEDDICPLEVTYGGKKYIIFNIGSNRKDFKGMETSIYNSSTNFVKDPRFEKVWATEFPSNGACFALCMDDD